MAANTLEVKQHAHELLEQLGPGQLAAVVNLLEVMIHAEDEELTEEDRRAIVQKTALRILQALHRYAETGEGRVKLSSKLAPNPEADSRS